MPSQDGATPAVLASKAGHRDIADLIAARGTSAARQHVPAQPPRGAKDDDVLYNSEQLRVGHLHPCAGDTVLCYAGYAASSSCLHAQLASSWLTTALSVV